MKARRASGFLLAALLGAMVSARPDATWSAEPVDAPGASRPVSEEAPRRQLPPALHAHHGALFPERPDVVGRTRDHAPPPVWREATRRFGRAVSLDADGRLRGYVAGTPFPTETIDCTEDPRAGDKLAWNFAHRWMGDGGRGTLRVSSWDQGELLGPPVVARWLLARLHHRVEPVHLAAEAKKERGALFPTARRTEALTLDIEHPFVQRGIRIVQYRYVSRLERPDDLWVYVPRRRRVQRIQSTRWTQALPGTDLVLEDWRGMGGPVRAHRFACEEERRILAPMRRRGAPDPLQEEATPPSPAEVARTHVVLEPRSAVRIRATPRDPRHPYGFKDLWLDRETFEPLYLLAYDREGRALRVGYQVNAWSGDVPERYSGWAGVPEPRDLFGVAWWVANVQLGTGVLWEAWDRTGTPLPSLRALRRAIDLQRGCVASGTLVATVDGPRQVETLRVGDRVLAFDPTTGKQVASAIDAIRRTRGPSTLRIGGLRITADHPVFVDGRFRPAGEIAAGSVLRGLRGPTVAGRAPEATPGDVALYDLSVAWPHTYFAGGVLVHNKSR